VAVSDHFIFAKVYAVYLLIASKRIFRKKV